MDASLLTTFRSINIALMLLLCAFLWRRSGLSQRPFFIIYLLFHAARSAALLAIPLNRTWYGHIYVATEPVLWVFYVLIVVELYGGALRAFTGIVTLSRWVLSGVIAVAVGLSLISLAPDLSSSHPYQIVHTMTAIGRAVCTSLALFLLGTTLFFLVYPIPLSRNTIVHSAVCSMYYLTHAAAYFVHNVAGPSYWNAVNLALVLLTGGTLLAWLVLLRPEGEHVIIRHRPQWSPEAEEQMLARLNALNGVLVRSIRK